MEHRDPLATSGQETAAASAGDGAHTAARRSVGSQVPMFLAGVIAAGVVMLAVLATTGSLGPRTTYVLAPPAGSAPAPLGSPGAATPMASAAPMTQSPGAAAERETVAPLTTLPPIARPASLTPTALANGYVLGSADAPVTVEVWEDFQCPYCRRYSEQVEPQVISAYVATGKVRYTFRSIPFLGDESGWAAVAADLAAAQGRFWPYHDYLMANQLGENVGGFTVSRLTTIADALGLDRVAFDRGMTLDQARTGFAKIMSAVDPAIHSTPTVLVNGTATNSVDWTTVKAAIDTALAAGH